MRRLSRSPNWPAALIAGALAAIAAIPPVTAASKPQPPPAEEAAAPDGGYRIGHEDVLDVAVWNNQALSRTVPVRPDGKISLPLLNDVHASGLTPMQLRDVLIARLTEFMPSPEVSVIVKEVHSLKISVLGNVKDPGRYEIGARATILDAIALAGGFSEFASPSRTMVLRPNGRTTARIPFDYKKAVSARGEEETLFLLPGDVVVVR